MGDFALLAVAALVAMAVLNKIAPASPSPAMTRPPRSDLSGIVDTEEGRYWLDTAGNARYFQAWGEGLFDPTTDV